MTALEEWRAWTKEPFEWNDVPDWEALQTETEEYAHNAINELLAEVAALKAQRNVIDVRPDGRYLTNVAPLVLNVVEDGEVEYLTLNVVNAEVRWQPREEAQPDART